LTIDAPQTPSLTTQFDELQQYFIKTPYLSINKRITVLKQLRSRIVEFEQELIDAVSKDFGYRTAFDTLLGDILPTMQALAHTIKKLPKWFKPSKRSVGLSLWPSKVSVTYQPKGVVGIIAPWNYPIQLAIVPVITALAAGNRTMLKLSEFTPHTNQVLEKLFSGELEQHCKIIQGGSDVASEFSSLPFAHLFFTGSIAVGKLVMGAASANLVPVTLELGGKSPAVLSQDCDLSESCKRLALAKSNNGGQVCVSPDIVYVPRNKLDQVAALLLENFSHFYPEITHNADFVPSVNRQHCQRVVDLVEQARDAGCQVLSSHEVANLAELVTSDKRLPLQLVISPDKELDIMQQEIFGAALVLLPYDDIDGVINDINSRAKPLALYYFGEKDAELSKLLANTSSGGVAINDCLMHAAMHDAPFGGVGASGMGHYHGREGFLAFSHQRTVFVAPKHDPRGEWGLLPPHHEQFKAMMVAQVTAD